MKQYTKKELREFVRLGLAVDLTEAEPEKIPASYTKVGFSRGIYGYVIGGLWLQLYEVQPVEKAV